MTGSESPGALLEIVVAALDATERWVCDLQLEAQWQRALELSS